MKIFKPDVAVNRIFDLDLNILKKNNIKGIVFDIDNTLAFNKEPEPSKEIEAYMNMLIQEGFKVAIASNNTEERVTLYSNKLKMDFEYRAAKPLSYKVRRLIKRMGLKRKQVCLVGDQLFTDMLGANMMGLFSVLVVPFDGDENSFIGFKRKIEKIIMKRWK